MNLELVEFGRLTEAQRAELEGDEEDPFDAAGNVLQWRKKERHVALRGRDGRLVASAGLVPAQIEIGGSEPVPVVGLGGVFVTQRHRGQGLARRVVAEALDRAATMGPDLIMLFCHRNRAGLYERFDFVEIPPPVLVEQPEGPVEMKMVAMWRPLRDGAARPPGQVTLRGLPF